MSRTLSIDKIGPDPHILRVRPFLYINPPAATSACLSDARLRSLISARGDSSLGNPLLRLGLPRRFDSLFTRVAPAALAEKETGVRSNSLGSDRGMGSTALGGSAHVPLFGHASHRLAPARRLPCGGDVSLVLPHSALEHVAAPFDRPARALGSVPPRGRVGRLAFGQVLRVRRAAQVVLGRLRHRPSQVPATGLGDAAPGVFIASAASASSSKQLWRVLRFSPANLLAWASILDTPRAARLPICTR